MPIIDIREGNTAAFTIPAVGVLIAGLICFAISPFVAVPVLAFAVSLFLVKSGIEIDAEGRRCRKYADYFGKKLGTWKPLAPCTQLVLQLSVESKTINTYFMTTRNSYGNGKTTFKSITYDIVLTDPPGDRMIFHDFMKYKCAQQALAALADALALEPVDRVAEKLAENRARRGR